jgi:hypothetical protein
MSRRYLIFRDSNVVLVDFEGEPDPPAPRFPGAGAQRSPACLSDVADAVSPWAPGLTAHAA